MTVNLVIEKPENAKLSHEINYDESPCHVLISGTPVKLQNVLIQYFDNNTCMVIGQAENLAVRHGKGYEIKPATPDSLKRAKHAVNLMRGVKGENEID